MIDLFKHLEFLAFAVPSGLPFQVEDFGGCALCPPVGIQHQETNPKQPVQPCWQFASGTTLSKAKPKAYLVQSRGFSHCWLRTSVIVAFALLPAFLSGVKPTAAENKHPKGLWIRFQDQMRQRHLLRRSCL